MFNVFKFLFSWKLIALAIAGYFLGDRLAEILRDAEEQAYEENEQLREDVDEFDLEEVEGIVGKIKVVTGKVKEKVSLILEQYRDETE